MNFYCVCANREEIILLRLQNVILVIRLSTTPVRAFTPYGQVRTQHRRSATQVGRVESRRVGTSGGVGTLSTLSVFEMKEPCCRFQIYTGPDAECRDFCVPLHHSPGRFHRNRRPLLPSPLHQVYGHSLNRTVQEYLNHLNDQQQAAVCNLDTPSLVIAGAGSGKTRVLTYKIVHLLQNGYEPWRIMALTFTNKAAREMRERVEALVGHNTASRLWMGTFHSIFARILRANADRIGFKSSFTIYDSSDSRSLIKTIIKDMGLSDKLYKPALVQSVISTAKNALVSPARYAADADIRNADAADGRPQLYEIYQVYVDRCFRSGAMDFDDLLYFTNILLRDNPDLLDYYRQYFRYVLVDEYQDTNFAQHLIINRLCQDTGHLCVVGDDAQSIYSFRGANIANILNLRKTYPDLQIFKLERNYRSTQNIVDAANSLIKKNINQIPKNVYSDRERGSRIEVAQTYSDFEEATIVAARISRLHTASGDSYDNYAVLYRTNAQSRILEEALRKRNIPYRIYGGLSFYQRKEVRDAIAYFRVTVNPDDDEALRRIINYPARGIGETTLNKLSASAVANSVSIWAVLKDIDRYNPGLNRGTLRKLADFVGMIDRFRQLDTSQTDALSVAKEIYTRTGLLAQFMSDRTPESISRRENLEELLNGIRQFVEQRDTEGIEQTSLIDFLAEVSLATDQDEEQDDQPRVTLMTVHASKGLEFDNVIVVGLEEDLFPSALAKDSPEQVEEERRLLYVAITRAARFCMLTFASSRYRNGQTMMTSPSRFLADIDMQYLKPVSGTRIPGVPAGGNPVSRYRSSLPSNPVSTGSLRPIPRSGSVPAPTPARTPAPSLAGATIHTADQLTRGMTIEHNLFGVGTITEIDMSHKDPRIIVDFRSGDTKVLLLKFARFRIVSPSADDN